MFFKKEKLIKFLEIFNLSTMMTLNPKHKFMFLIPMFILFTFLHFFFNIFELNFLIFTNNFNSLFSQDLPYHFKTLYDKVEAGIFFSLIIFHQNFSTNYLLELDFWDLKAIITIITLLNGMVDNATFLSWLQEMSLVNFSINFPLLTAFSNNSNLDLPFFIIDEQKNSFQNQPFCTIFFPEFIDRLIKDKIISALIFTNFFSLYLKEKIFYFFLVNFLLITLMLLSLNRLYSSTNLIYALLYFLAFAVLSGLLIIFWGSFYIGFCVLLIYGAAIPVLALYIIMLVNVDLIQRLFFFEHINKTISIYRNKKLSLILLFFIYFFFCFKNVELFILKNEFPILSELFTNSQYFFFAKRHFLLTEFPNNSTNIYNLVLTFYTSDLDKVASVAFKTSYNELIALVFLLLIAIIVVISISRTSGNNYYLPETNTIKLSSASLDFLKFLITFKLKVIRNSTRFFKKNQPQPEIYGTRYNSIFDPFFLYTLRSNLLDLKRSDVNDMHINMNTRLAVDTKSPKKNNDPWTEWYTAYALDFSDETLKKTSAEPHYTTLNQISILDSENDLLTYEDEIDYISTKRTTF